MRALMQSQHKAILKELKGGRHEGRITAFFRARGEPLDAPRRARPTEARALDLDAAPPRPPSPRRARDVALGSTFADTFDDEPTTLDPPEYSAVSSTADVIEESARARHADPDARRHPGRAHRDLPHRPPRAPPTWPAGGRRRDAGDGRPGGGPANRGGGRRGRRRCASRRMRARRPAQSIPYVVKEGTHPLAEPAEKASQLDLPLAAGRRPGERRRAPRPRARRPPPAPEPVADRSLDEVILAYLAGGENDQR